MPSKKTQKAVFWVLTILIGVGLVASSVVWTLPDQASAPPTPPPEAENAPQEAANPADFSALEAKVEANPRDIPARLQLAQAYRNAGEFDKAIAAYGEILKLDGDNQNARLSLAEVYAYQERYDEALSELDRLLAANPRHQGALGMAVEVAALGKQDYQGAIARLENYVKVVGDGPEAEAARQMIDFYRQMAEQAEKDQESKQQATKE
ncbi:MAG: tetratricopeptide repeat protein [Thermoanaerobacterales bacterium]|nr:tetratricopeptide repeat protein [Thermoanaerobacterales bacterium]